MNYLERLPKGIIICLGLLLVLTIGSIDYLVTIDLSLSIFYLLPIILTTWLAAPKIGFFLSYLSAICWFVADISARNYPYAWIPYWNTGVRLGFFLTVTYLLSALKITYEREKNFAQNDVLTAAFNRRFFLELLQKEWQRCRRYKHPLTLVYFDVDNFKSVNDRLGHPTGDRLLQIVVEIVKREIRTTDIVARLGGDEFAILLLETHYEAATTVLERLRRQLLAAMEGQSFPVTFSIGAITFTSLPDSVDLAIERVDRLMYEVKKNGKNGIKHELVADSTRS